MLEGDATHPEPVHESGTVLVLRVIFFQACLAVAAILASVILVTSIDTSNGTGGAGVLSLALSATILILLTLDAFFITSSVIQWAHRRYIITPDEIVVESGGAPAERRVYKTDDIEAVKLQQFPLGKLFNYGTIFFYSIVFREGVSLPNLPNPESNTWT